ncbi:hypothetical protein O0544_22970 [Edwardsiella anguillarum]|nr:hypothetical protein [Edwardsiella anguillarum]
MMESTQVENGMELRATKLGQRLAQHPYNRVRVLNAGIEVSGERHQYLIPFNQLMALRCKRDWYGVSWSLSCRISGLSACMARIGRRHSDFISS